MAPIKKNAVDGLHWPTVKN